MRIGDAILALLLFRVVWGFIGSDTARFTRFLRSPVGGAAALWRICGGGNPTGRSATTPPAAGWCW